MRYQVILNTYYILYMVLPILLNDAFTQGPCYKTTYVFLFSYPTFFCNEKLLLINSYTISTSNHKKWTWRRGQASIEMVDVHIKLYSKCRYTYEWPWKWDFYFFIRLEMLQLPITCNFFHIMSWFMKWSLERNLWSSSLYIMYYFSFTYAHTSGSEDFSLKYIQFWCLVNHYMCVTGFSNQYFC